MTGAVNHAGRRPLKVLMQQGFVVDRLFNRVRGWGMWARSAVGMTVHRVTDGSAVLYGRVDDEENLLVLALALSGSYTGQVILLAGNPERVKRLLSILEPAIAGSEANSIVVLERTPASVRRLHYRSEVVITSHVLLWSPRAFGRRLHVHVSHGLGPKSYRNPPSSEIALASTSTVWNSQQLDAMGKSSGTKIIRGLPRQDLLFATGQSRAAALARLGFDPHRPIVVWAPTIRTANFNGGQWTEGARMSSDEPLNTWHLVSQFKASADRYGVQLVAKPHPIEADSIRSLGIRVLDNGEIWDAGISVYQFLGMTDGLVSDYSSLWVDYLATGRSIALFCPDRTQFEGSIRGLLTPPLDSLAGGLFINSAEDVEELFQVIGSRGIFRAKELVSCRDAVGFVECAGSRCEAFLEDLALLGDKRGIAIVPTRDASSGTR